MPDDVRLKQNLIETSHSGSGIELWYENNFEDTLDNTEELRHSKSIIFFLNHSFPVNHKTILVTLENSTYLQSIQSPKAKMFYQFIR